MSRTSRRNSAEETVAPMERRSFTPATPTVACHSPRLPSRIGLMPEPLRGSFPFVTVVPGSRLRNGLTAALLNLQGRLRRHRERQRLWEMEARLLRDIGLDHRAAVREARKWWWQV